MPPPDVTLDDKPGHLVLTSLTGRTGRRSRTKQGFACPLSRDRPAWVARYFLPGDRYAPFFALAHRLRPTGEHLIEGVHTPGARGEHLLHQVVRVSGRAHVAPADQVS